VKGDPINKTDRGGLDEDPDYCQIYPDDPHCYPFYNPFGLGQPGGDPNIQGNSSGTIRVKLFASSDPRVTGVQNSLRTLREALKLDEKCMTWLSGGGFAGGVGGYDDILAALLGEKDFGVSADFRSAMTATVGSFDSAHWSVNAVSGTAGTDLPGGTLMTINAGGAFFGSNLSADNGRITGGTDLAKAFILVHELAHLTSAAGFADGDSGQPGTLGGQRQIDNNNLIHDKCQTTLDRFK
jgi:hypothetical protein